MNESKSSKEITLIAAASENNALGKDNKLIWHLSEDLKRFKRLTQGHAIIMGRKTFESMPRALPNRKNIVLTNNKDYQVKDAWVAHSIDEALRLTDGDPQPFIIGGGEVYKLFLPIADKIELTRVHSSFEADTFFPDVNYDNWKSTEILAHIKDENNPHDFKIMVYDKLN